MSDTNAPPDAAPETAKETASNSASGSGDNRQFWLGVRDAAPLFISGVPFGLLFGILAVEVGLGIYGGIGFSSLIFAGSAQFVGADLYGKDTGLLIIWGVVLLLNARHLLYALDLSKRCPHWPTWGRLIIGYFLTDESYAVTARRLDAKPDEALPLAYFTGASLGMFFAWNLATIAGVILAASLPDISNLGIEIAIYSAYLAIIVPMIITLPRLGVAVAAVVLSLAFKDLPHQLGLVVGTFGGIGLGIALDALLNRENKDGPQSQRGKSS